MYRWPAWIVVTLVAAAFAGGCGGDDGEDSATAWAGDVCSAITTWRDSITTAADSLRGGNLSEDTLKSAADDIGSSTNEFIDDIRGLGTPETDDGEQAKESIDQLADQADANLSAIESAVDDVTDLSGAVQAVTTVSAAISTMGTQLSSTFAELEKLDPGGELEQAFRDADSCDELQSG
jgi:hypothetical protein